MSQRTVQRQRAAPVRMVPVVVRRSGRLMVMLRLMMGLLRLLVVVVRVVGARVAVRATEQGRARSLPVETTLVVLCLVRSVSVRFDPQHEQNDENDGNQGTSDNADNHRRTLLGLGVDAAALVLGKARWRVRLRVRLVRLLRFGIRRFGHLHWRWTPTVRRLVHGGTVLLPVVLVVRWQVHVHYLLLGSGRCLRVGRFADMITIPIAVADGRFGRDVLLCQLLAVEVVNTSVTSPLPDPCRQSSSSHSFSPALPLPRPLAPSLPPPEDVVAVCLVGGTYTGVIRSSPDPFSNGGVHSSSSSPRQPEPAPLKIRSSITPG
uniref:Uncharacterized protein n=1 Tax=Anopheles melas TaxID=34690 RepID=A0A182UKF8_9DIPT